MTVAKQLPSPTAEKGGDHQWSLLIRRVLLKDDNRVMVNAHVVVSAFDSQGRCLVPPQTTSEALIREGNTLRCDVPIYMHTALAELRDANLFFELRHVKGKKISVRCWAYSTLKAVRKGALELPLYQKPVDLKLRRLKRFNPKQSYEFLVDVDVVDNSS